MRPFHLHSRRSSSRPDIDATRIANSGRDDDAWQTAAPYPELSSDAYDGRLPGTSGEEKSVAYVISQIKSIGLQPGTPTSGFVQRVPLYGIRSRGTLAIAAGGTPIRMSPGEDFVLWSNLPDERIDVRDSDVVFAGYGVVAPEYKWNDYAGVDVKGKTVIVINGDPPVADPGDSTKLDERVFLGNALTVYGRTGTKLATAFNHGAAAVLLGPPAEPLRYVWENNARENMTLRDGNERQQLKVQALVSIDKAATIFAAAGNDFERARAAAAEPGFRLCTFCARHHHSDQPRAQVRIAEHLGQDRRQ